MNAVIFARKCLPARDNPWRWVRLVLFFRFTLKFLAMRAATFSRCESGSEALDFLRCKRCKQAEQSYKALERVSLLDMEELSGWGKLAGSSPQFGGISINERPRALLWHKIRSSLTPLVR